MIDASQLEQYVIRPTLDQLDLLADNTVQLLLLTCAQESNGGRYLHQLGRGPAVGIYQMEPFTHDDIHNNFLKYKGLLRNSVNAFKPSGKRGAGEMAGNLYYATAMARCHYLRDPHPIPQADDVQGLAEYYKRVYNTHLGAATAEEALEAYRQYVE